MLRRSKKLGREGCGDQMEKGSGCWVGKIIGHLWLAKGRGKIDGHAITEGHLLLTLFVKRIILQTPHLKSFSQAFCLFSSSSLVTGDRNSELHILCWKSKYKIPDLADPANGVSCFLTGQEIRTLLCSIEFPLARSRPALPSPICLG
jgi:hypothetical protein